MYEFNRKGKEWSVKMSLLRMGLYSRKEEQYICTDCITMKDQKKHKKEILQERERFKSRPRGERRPEKNKNYFL